MRIHCKLFCLLHSTAKHDGATVLRWEALLVQPTSLADTKSCWDAAGLDGLACVIMHHIEIQLAGLNHSADCGCSSMELGPIWSLLRETVGAASRVGLVLRLVDCLLQWWPGPPCLPQTIAFVAVECSCSLELAGSVGAASIWRAPAKFSGARALL